MRERLLATVGPVYFSDLRAHLTRDAVIVVDVSVELVDAGVAIANDDKALIEEWIRSGVIRKPSLEDVDRWSMIADARWESLIVAPFVLVRELDGPRLN